jgi:hypothetical protein
VIPGTVTVAQRCDPGFEKPAAGRWVSTGAEPLFEPTGLNRLLTDLASTWINLELPTLAVVAPEGFGGGVAHLPAEVPPLDFFGSSVALAGAPCPGCATRHLLSIGVRGGGHVITYIHAGVDTSPLIPYHLSERPLGVPDEGRARPLGIVLGSVPGEIGTPDLLARMLWTGEDGRPVGWSGIRRDPDDPALLDPSRGWFWFDRSVDLSASHRLLWLDPEESRQCELLACDLTEGQATLVRRLHSLEAEALRDLELIP